MIGTYEGHFTRSLKSTRFFHRSLRDFYWNKDFLEMCTWSSQIDLPLRKSLRVNLKNLKQKRNLKPSQWKIGLRVKIWWRNIPYHTRIFLLSTCFISKAVLSLIKTFAIPVVNRGMLCNMILIWSAMEIMQQLEVGYCGR